jgi:hypothetical protein
LSLPVPLSPTTRQLSVIVALALGKMAVISIGLPSALRRGRPSVSVTGQCAASHAAWRLPLAKLQAPSMR